MNWRAGRADRRLPKYYEQNLINKFTADFFIWLFYFSKPLLETLLELRQKVIAMIENLAVSAAENMDIEGACLDEIEGIVDDYWYNMGYIDCEQTLEDDPAEAKIAQ